MKKYILLLYCLIGMLSSLVSQSYYEYDAMCPKIVGKGDIFICTIPLFLNEKIEWVYDNNYVQYTGGPYADDFIELKASKAGNTQIKVKQYQKGTFGGWSHYMTTYQNLTIKDEGCVTVDYSTTDGFSSGGTYKYSFRVSSCKLNFATDLNGTFTGISIIQGKESITLKTGVHIKSGSNLSLVIGNTSLRSISNNESNSLDIDDENEGFSESIFEAPIAASISNVIEVSQPVLVNVYSITGLPVYSSTTDFNIHSANLSRGIYIIETINNRGETKREKVLVNR